MTNVKVYIYSILMTVVCLRHCLTTYSTVQYSTVQCSGVVVRSYSTVQYSTVQYSTVQCSGVVVRS